MMILDHVYTEIVIVKTLLFHLVGMFSAGL